MAKVQSARGLKNYIQELRNCSTLEAEKERVDKELGKIRKKYTSDKAMSAYDKRKYMWKLLYTRMLGYDVEFGQRQAMDLIAANGYSEKQVGYVACAIFLNERDELLRLVINSVRNDLISRNEAFQCLALEFVANVGGAEFAQLLTQDVMNVLTNGATRPVVRKKAALCLLRLIRKAPADADVMPASEWAVRMAALLEERDPGVLLGLTTLLLGVVSRSYEGYEACVPRLVRILDRMKARDVPQDYTYYGLASPWLQVRALRVLQYFPPPEDPALLRALADTLKRILAGNEPAKNANKNNAVHAIVFEAVALAVGLGDSELLSLGVALLARFLTVREANLKYLALENLGRLAVAPEVAQAVGRHQKTVTACLQDEDVSIRRRALDLVFSTASPDTAAAVVEELLAALPRADFALREELVLKAAVLAERFLPSREWYVDAMLRLMEAAGDAALDDVWQSVAQLATSDAALQPYAAGKAAEALRRGAASEVFVRCAAFLLGEYGRSLPGADPSELFSLLHARFPAATAPTKAMLLSAYEKMRAAAPGDAALAASVEEVLERHSSAADTELQQRAVEYRGLAARPEAAAAALQPLPPWEKRTSLLLRRLAEREGDGEDEARERPAWLQQEGERAAEATASASETAEPQAAAAEEGAAAEAEAPKGEQPGSATAKAAGPANGAAAVDLLDLLDLSDTPPKQPSSPAAATPSAAPATAEATPLDMLASLEPSRAAGAANPFAQAPAGAAAASTIQPTGDLDRWLLKLCVGASGVLYEDANLQVGLRMGGQGASAQLGIFLGNKSKQRLERLVCAVPPAPAFSLSADAAPAALEPGQQVQVQLRAGCEAPFTRPPVLQLAYSLPGGGGSLNRTLALPLVVTKFCQPVDVPASVFATRWAQVAGAPFKLSERLPRPAGADVDAVARLLAAMRLRLLDVRDLEGAAADAICAACVFHCGGRQVPCMVAVEGVGGGASSLAVTVATADAMTTDALKAQLVRQLAALA